MSIRDEFHRRNVRLSHPDLSSFPTSKWMSPGVYLAYRWILALYISADVLVDRILFNRWYSFAFTFWGLISITLYLNLAAILSTAHYARTRRDRSRRVAITTQDGGAADTWSSDAETDVIQVSPKCLWLHKIMWALFSVCSLSSVIVTVGYWGFLYSFYCDIRCVQGLYGFINVNSHLINAVVMLLDGMIVNMPVRLYHVVYANIYGIIYYLATVAVWLATDKKAKFYYFLDYSERPWLALGVALGGLIVVMPLLQLLYYGIYRFRLWLQEKVLHSRHRSRDEGVVVGEMHQIDA